MLIWLTTAQRDEAAHSNARGNLVKMNNLLGTEAREFSSFVGILETVARGKLPCLTTNSHF